MKSGIVSIMGSPNVGKSTLINSLLDMHLAIVSNKVGTTRNVIQGVYNDYDSQIVFVDTPGIDKPMDKLGNILNKKSYSTLDNVDIVLFLIDARIGIKRKEEAILNRLEEEKIDNIFLVINKIDLISKEGLYNLISEIHKTYNFKEIIPVSAYKQKNIEEIIKTIKNYLPNDGKIFDDETLTNISTRFYVSEIVREKIMRLTDKEVPHSITCLTEELIVEKEKVIIRVLIIVDRDSLKKILIGKNGDMIKKIGILSRKDLEEYFGKKVFLETFVKTLKNWREEEKYLKELNLSELEN